MCYIAKYTFLYILLLDFCVQGKQKMAFGKICFKEPINDGEKIIYGM